MLNNRLLLSKQWRDEIKEVTEDYTATVNRGQGPIASEEIAIETTLRRVLVATKSKYLNLKSADEGLNLDSTATEAERNDWQNRRITMEKTLHAYQAGPMKLMQAQVQMALDLVKKLKANVN